MQAAIGKEETSDPVYADERNFYKVERWTADDQHIAAMLYAGNDLADRRVPAFGVVEALILWEGQKSNKT